MQSSIVDTVQTALQTVVFATNSGQQLSTLANWDIEGVDSVLFTAGVKLCKDNCSVAVECCVSQVVLVAVSIRSVNNKLFGAGVIGGSCANRSHI